MNIEQLNTLHESRPFRPFIIHVADGRDLPIEHPEFLAPSPSGNIATVFESGDSFEIVDFSSVTGLEIITAVS